MDWQKLYQCLNELNRAASPFAIEKAFQKIAPLIGADICTMSITEIKFKTEHACLSFAANADICNLQNRHCEKCSNKGFCTCHELPSDNNLLSTSAPKQLSQWSAYEYTSNIIIPLGKNHKLGIFCYKRKEAFSEQSYSNLHTLSAALIPWAWNLLQQHLSNEKLTLKVSLECLTAAEKDVLKFLTEGMDGSEIARARGVKKETVRSQIKSLLHKTDSRHQNQLLSQYFQNQL